MNQISPLYSILINSKDRPNALIRCVKSVLAQTYKNLEVLVLDDNSDERLCDRLTHIVADRRVKCIRSDVTLGVAGGRNKLIKSANGDFLIILDDDAAFRNNDSLNRIIELFHSHPDVGLLALKIVDLMDSEQVRVRVPFRRLTIKRNPQIINLPQYVSYFLGGGHAVRKEVFEKCGLYEENLLYGGEEIDLSYRMIHNGYKLFYTPDVIVNHYIKYLGMLTSLARRKYLYLSVRNKIWINYKYLPWSAFVINTIIWASIRIVTSFFTGGLTQTIRGIIGGFRGLKNVKRTPVSKEAIRYIRLNNGRLFF